MTKRVSKVYYIESYHGYPAKGRFNSELAFKSTTSFVSTFEDKEEPREGAYQLVDFKELFICRILSDLGLGPQVHLLFNPYLKDGVHLVTQDIRESDQQFTEIGKLPSALDTHLRSTLLKLQEGKLSIKDYESWSTVANMLELDTVNRIFRL